MKVRQLGLIFTYFQDIHVLSMIIRSKTVALKENVAVDCTRNPQLASYYHWNWAKPKRI